MPRLLTILSSILMLHTAAHAQTPTYIHDASKMNQITVGEIGTGSLTPPLYYTLFHNAYQRTAAAKNKLTYRTLAGANAYMQVSMAESVDSAMTKRAEVEALNIADRSGGALDLAWSIEGDKVMKKLNDYHHNIQRIIGVGGTGASQRRWLEYYNIFKTAIKATQDAYMPNAQRKKEYLKIYADICRQNDSLVKYIVMLYNANKTQTHLAAASRRIESHTEVQATSLSSWRDAGWRTTPSPLPSSPRGGD